MRNYLRTAFLVGLAGLFAGCNGSDSGGDSVSAVVEDSGAKGSSDAAGPATGSADGCELEAYQKELLEQVNAARSEGRMCGSESYAAVDPLTYSCVLEQAARVHSEDMATNNFSSHTGSDGMSVSQRVTATGYTWRAVGENIAGGYQSVADVTEGWLASAGHCANIMSPNFTEFGAARVDSSTADYATYWTQVFAAPR